MAIPIKCPGCQAAFEVPEALAGKTIRCTSCKTQLTVPAALDLDEAEPVPAASGEKKPFGWAAGGPPKPAAPAPKAPPSANPAPPKAKAKAAVELDDDEDEKRRPAKSAAPAGKSRAARRRDDDDDEDEDDDRPARKPRKKNSGSPAMPLLIGGGVLGLLAIIGVVIYLAMGSSDDKKNKETAKNDTPAAAPMTPMMPGGATPGAGTTPGGMPMTAPMDPMTPAGMPPIGIDGMPIMAAPGGGMAPALPPGWQAVTGDGFVCGMPAQPKVMSSRGLSVLALEQRGGAEVFIVTSTPFPPGVGQVVNNPAARNKILDEMARGAVQSGNQGGGGKVRLSIAGTTDVTLDGFPGRDVNLTADGGKGSGTVRMILGGSRIYMFLILGESITPELTRQFLGTCKITEGGSQVAMGPGMPGMGMPMTAPPATMPPPIGIDGKPIAVGPNGMPIIPNTNPVPAGPGMPMVAGPGMPMVAGPGMPMVAGPGMPMFPGGPMSPNGDMGNNAPPAGAETRPARKARVEPFLAAAFDPEAGEVYTVAPRFISGQKVGGYLYRYTYPDFGRKNPAMFHLPLCGTRAAIDPKKGLLYVATAPTATHPGTLQKLVSGQFDSPTAVGDVQAFDLTALRSGKVEERVELKPVATISVGAGQEIVGMELAPDGKALYVLTTRTVSGRAKSAIKMVDTADRKVVKEKDLPDRAWAMKAGADGKLLVIDYPPKKTLTVFDPAAWAIARSYTQPGLTTDVTTTKGGQLVASVMENNQPKLYLYDADGNPQEVVVPGWKAAASNFYLGFSPGAESLFVTAMGNVGQQGIQHRGLDVYKLAGADAAGVKKVASIQTAGGLPVGGHFHLSPDGDYLMFQTGAVLEVAKLTENVGGTDPEPGAGGTGVPGFPGPGGPGAGTPMP